MEKMRNIGSVPKIGSDTREYASHKPDMNNIPSRLKNMLKDLSKEELVRQEVDREVGRHFFDWFHHWTGEMRKLIENPELRDDDLILKIEFFLHDLEHHFTASHASRKIRNAFRYLGQYFRFYPCVAQKHSRKASGMLRRIEDARSLNFQEAGAEVRAWFGNRIWIVLRAIESPRFKDLRAMADIEFFLESIGDYFINSRSRHFRNASRYLRHYFAVYPCIRRRESERAIEMIARIYQGMNYEFRYEASIKPGPMDIEEEVKILFREPVAVPVPG